MANFCNFALIEKRIIQTLPPAAGRSLAGQESGESNPPPIHPPIHPLMQPISAGRASPPPTIGAPSPAETWHATALPSNIQRVENSPAPAEVGVLTTPTPQAAASTQGRPRKGTPYSVDLKAEVMQWRKKFNKNPALSPEPAPLTDEESRDQSPTMATADSAG